MRYARNPAVLWRSTSRGPVVLIPGRDDPERLGGIAAVVWEVLDHPMDETELGREVSALIDPAPAGLRVCLATLVGAALVVDEGGP